MSQSRCLVAALALMPAIVGAQTLQEFTPAKPGAPQVIAFASGNAKSVIAQPKDATSATGSLGLTYLGANFIVSGVVNVPAKTDTMTTRYGAAMLAPAAGTTTSALLDVRLPTVVRCDPCAGLGRYLGRVGVHGYAAASGSRWATQFNSSGSPIEVEDISMWSTGIGASYRFFDGWMGKEALVEGNRVGLSLDVLAAFRNLRGNLGMAADSVRRERLLGTKGRAFGGAEFGLNLRYNEATAGLTYYHMGGSIKGFSGGQVVAGISFRTKLASGPFSNP